MDRVEVTRNGETDEFSVVLTRGSDTVRCMVTVAASNMPDEEKRRAALSKAKGLAKALDAAIEDQ
jgi:hypothetical protein